MLLLDKSGSAFAQAPSAIVKASSADFAFAGDFTIEIFKMKFASTADQILVGNTNASSPFANQRSWLIQYISGAIHFTASTDGTSGTSANAPSYTWTPNLGVEYDIAYDRSGSTVRLYIDGIMVASATFAGALHQSTTTYLTIGQGSSGSGFTLPSDGSCKAVRISDGVARYGTDGSYTVPSLPLPAS